MYEPFQMGFLQQKIYLSEQREHLLKPHNTKEQRIINSINPSRIILSTLLLLGYMLQHTYM